METHGWVGDDVWFAHAIHVGKWEDCDRLCEEVYSKWGRCDVLINNAGLSPLAPSLLETSEDLRAGPDAASAQAGIHAQLKGPAIFQNFPNRSPS